VSIGSERKKAINIRFCGLGGMGVLLASIILGKAAIYDNRSALQTQSYGAEQRGTKVKADVIISEEDFIVYPEIEKPDILIAFSQTAFDFYITDTTPDTQLFLNSDLIEFREERPNVYSVPANQLALELKNEKIANIIMLGALIRTTSLVSKDSIIKAIAESVSKALLDLNVQAFQTGYDFL
jgi:2-oxoglutarate ferredoxin oxidoreductase subunit gamma